MIIIFTEISVYIMIWKKSIIIIIVIIMSRILSQRKVEIDVWFSFLEIYISICIQDEDII